MKSIWTKKNPLMSMYLSGANAVAGSIRSRATAEARRQVKTSMTKGMKEVAGFWSGVLAPPTPRRRKKKIR